MLGPKKAKGREKKKANVRLKKVRSKKTLKLKLQQLFSIFDNIDEIVYVADPETYEVLYANQALLRDRGHVVGKKCYRVFQGLDSPCSFCTNKYIFGKNVDKTYAWEFQNRVNRRWYRCLDKAIPWTDGRMVRYEMAIDITDRIKAEKALRESEEKFRTISENINVGLHRNTPGPKGRFIEVNPAEIRMFGYENKREFLKLRVSDLYQNPADRKRFNERIQRQGFVKDEVLHLKKKDGTAFIASVSAVVVRDEKGRVKYYDGIVEDITERVKMEEALHESEETYKTLVQTSPEAIIVVDMEGRIIHLSQKAFELYRTKNAEDLLGHKAIEFVAPEDHEKAEAIGQKALEEGSARNAELRAVRRDGSQYIAEMNITLMRDSEGKPKAFIATHRDITDRRNTEKALEASLKEKEVLLREIHHRVKNNMQVISSLLNLESRYIKEEDSVKRLRDCQGRIRSMALVHEKLYQSQSLSRIDFSEYIRSLVIYLFHFYRIDSNLIRFHSNMARVFLDINTAIPCGLIVNELVSNSLKHAFPDGKEGDISVELSPAENQKFQLTVRDNGIGFPESIDIRKTETLGMQIVTMLVDQLDGKIEVEREGGTCFKITFGELKYKPRL